MQQRLVALMNTKQVAELLGLSTRQVLRLGIPHVRLGRRTIRYRVEDVQNHVHKATTN